MRWLTFQATRDEAAAEDAMVERMERDDRAGVSQ
jgi:hypothetical protein